MLYRLIAAAVILLGFTLPAHALNLSQPADEALATAVARMKVKDYSGARQAALKSDDKGKEKGARAFVLGISSLRLELWEEAASNLATAAEYYPILADYALYNQGLALSELKRPDQALPPLYKMVKEYPESRLARSALLLYADTLAVAGHTKEALQSYASFMERYPSGSDSISALYDSALCREKLGDPAAAAEVLRGIWLKYPASPFAEKASRELKRLTAAGTKVEPYTTAELFKRCGTLYSLKRYKQAAQEYGELPLEGQPQEFVAKVKLKTGQALYKARRYKDAQAAFSELRQSATDGDTVPEASLWFARTLEKSGSEEEAFELLLKLAGPSGSVADDALLEAAYLKRYQRKWDEAAHLFRRYLAIQPKNTTVMWEAAWSGYQSRDYQGAAGDFRKLAEHDELREKALYWLGKSLAAAGDSKGAEAAFATLSDDYPFGYYALICNKWCDPAQAPLAAKNLTGSLPMPAGFDREKALMNLGLYDEAARELTQVRRKNPLGAARLYLEMGNYNGAYHSVANLTTPNGEKESPSIWGVKYPQAFSEDVARNASANALSENLVYAIMRTESNYLPTAKSPVGAVGLMQIMPATAEALSKGGSARLTTPELNIKLGAKHLRDLMDLYDRNLTLVIAAYNAGSGNVKRWQKGYGDLPEDEFVESIPFKETREYVKKVVTAMELYERLYRVPVVAEKK